MNFNYKKMTRLMAVLLVALFSLPTFAQNVDCSGVADWTSQSYSGGQEVVLDGKLYKANWWTQSNPANDNGVEGSGKSWTLLGNCGVSTPEISITSLVNGQELYLKASETTSVEVSVNTAIDSVMFVVVDILCNGPGCTESTRYYENQAPYTLNLTPRFDASYSQITPVAYKNGIGYSGNSVDVIFNQIPEIYITSPGNTQPFHLDAEANETVPLSVVVDGDVDSVQYVVVDILCNGPGCASVNKYNVTTAPYTYNLTPTYGASYTDVTAIAFKNGQGYASTSVETYFYALPKVSLSLVGGGYFRSGETLPIEVDVNDDVAQIDSVVYVVVNVLCNGPGCADVKRYAVTEAPYNLDLVPTFGASHSEVTALAYAHGVGANSPQTVDFEAYALPELRITNLPETGGLVYVDGTDSYSFDVNVDVNDEDVAIDSVQYVLIQHSGYGPQTRVRELYKTVKSAPFNVTFDETEAFLGQNWTRVVAIPFGDEGKTAGSQSIQFDLIANPIVEITSLVDGQYHYLKASENPTVDVEVVVNDEISQIDSVYYIVVDLLCNGPGCANVRKFTKTEAPYTLTLDPIFGASYTEIYAIAFSNGRSSNSSYSIDNYFVALPEATFLNITDGEDYVTDANNPEIFVDIDVNDELIQIDSVQYILVQHSGYGPYPTVRELYKTVTTAPFDITFNSSEVYLDQNWTRVIAIPFGDGGKTAGSVSAQINVIAEANTCNVAAWVSGTQYCGGTEVSHNGIIYVADWCTSNEPGTGQWIGWTEAGACGSARVAMSSSVSVSVYPNPVVDVLTIANADNFTSYVVVDVLGNVIAEGSVNGTVEINTSTWKSGTYVVRLIGETNENISIVK